MRVIVTGACGFVGSRVVLELLSKGYEVHAVVNPSTDRWRLSEVVEKVVFHETRLDVPPFDPDLLIHLAWYAVPGRYLDSSQNLECLEQSERLAKAVKCRIVAAGTCFEYAESSAPLSEESALAPGTLYARCKDSLRSSLAARGGYAWARLFYMYGPGEDPRRLVPSLAIPLLEGREARLTHGQQRRDYSHVDDSARAIVAIAESAWEGPVNVGSGAAPKVVELAQMIASRVNQTDLLRVGAVPAQPGEAPCVLANIERLRSFGWSASHDMKSGVDDAVRWWENAPLGRRKAWKH